MKSARNGCLECTLKHLSQATILLLEFQKSPDEYGNHFDFAIGHIAEAEDQSISISRELSEAIRAERIKLLSSFWDAKLKYNNEKEISDNIYYPDFETLRELAKVLKIKELSEKKGE